MFLASKTGYRERLVMAAIAVALDVAFGDPPDELHPVKWLGRLIARLERTLYPADSGYTGGVVFASVTVSATATVSALFLRAAGGVSTTGRVLAGSILIYNTISLRQLTGRALEIQLQLEENRIPDARNGAKAIVGRDTDGLDCGELVRATVESVAENLSDGVIAPLLYALAGGPVCAAAYRTANTLDSMVGYRDARYMRFGWASARLDDVLNLAPARITALALAAASWLRGGDPARVARVACRDARRHDSPNAGWPEAAMAGALGVRLGGTNRYRGVPVACEYMGDALEPLEPERITEAVALARQACLLFICAFTLLSLLSLLTVGRRP
ncbi:MAG TPA: adenosylcobinamide-phosphate synthase CbiB [Candidatus Anoxymicrobiaceae bacterium]